MYRSASQLSQFLVIFLFMVAIVGCEKGNDAGHAGLYTSPEGHLQSHDAGSTKYSKNKPLIKELNSALKAGGYSEALKLANQILDKTPLEYAAYHSRATAYYYLANYEKASSDYKKAIKLNPLLYHSYSGLASIQLQAQQYDAAIDNYSKSIKINSGYASAFYSRGSAYLSLGEEGKAIDDYEKVVGLLTPGSELYKRAKLKLDRLSK